MEVKPVMNIERAIKHLSWRLSQNKIIPNEKDIDAFNVVIRTINQGYENALMKDKCFAKLLIERLLYITIDGKMSMKDAVITIEETLNSSVHSWVKKFVSEVPMIKFSQVFEEKMVELNFTEDDISNVSKLIEAKQKIFRENQKEFENALAVKYTEEDFIKLIQRLVFELTTKYQNAD